MNKIITLIILSLFPYVASSQTIQAVSAQKSDGKVVSPPQATFRTGNGIQTAFQLITATSLVTNFVITATNNCVYNINALDDVNITATGTGTASVEIFNSSGGNILMTFPTNWPWLSTNGLTVLGARYSATLTNKHFGYLSFTRRLNNDTNTLSGYSQTPLPIP